LVSELASENGRVLADLEASSKPTVAVLNEPELVHFAAIVRASSATVEELLRAVESAHAARFFPLCGVWQGYAAAVVAYYRGTHAELPVTKAKGYEKFMLPYIRYMCARTDEGRAAARVEAVQSFSLRNADHRLTDWIGLDGDGKQPVRWDFRLYAIETARPSSS
jgi:hypothetical protein